MAEESESQSTATPTNGNALNLPEDNSDSAWNYTWDEKLCKTTLQLFKPKVYTPPVLPLPDETDPKFRYVCPVEGCNKSFSRASKTTFRLHLKRHEIEKPFKCHEPACTKAFYRYDELARHYRTHTGEKPYECEQCGRRFSRSHHLTRHLETHIKGTNMKNAPLLGGPAEELNGNDSDGAIDLSSDESSSDLDVYMKQEVDIETDTDTETDEDEDNRHETEEIKVAPPLPTFYSSDQRIQINDTKIEESSGAGGIINSTNDFISNNTSSSSSFVPIQQSVPVKQENQTSSNSFVPMQLIPVKQENHTDATQQEYDQRFEQRNQYDMKEIKNEPRMVAEPYFPDFYSSNDPTSMSAAIHRLAYPNPFNTANNIKTESYPTNNIESQTLSAAIHHLAYSLPIAEQNNITLEADQPTTNNTKSVTKPKKNRSKSKTGEKRYKCSVEGCDRAFIVPYGLKRHSWVHTKVKPFECDKCQKRFLRKDHLGKHMKTHTRVPVIKLS